MKNCYLIALLLIVPLCTISAAGSLGKPRYNKSVAFNEVVHLELSTLLPKTNFDAKAFEKTIVNAMDMPNNRPNWFLANDPVVSLNDKSRFILIKINLLARQTGTLRLPEIPMEWLNETKIPNLGDVEVREEIIIGNNTQKIPIEIEAVGGFPWNAEHKDLMKKLSKAKHRKDGEQDIYTTKDGLELMVRKKKLAGARILTNGWHLRQARFNFIDRWGEPYKNGLNEAQPHMIWLMGWLRIDARETVVDGKPKVTVLITREDIENRMVEESMNKQIFKLLESDQTAEEIWQKDKKVMKTDPEPEKKAVTEAQEKALKEVTQVEEKPIKEANKAINTNAEETPAVKPEVKKENKKIDPKILEDLFKEAQSNTKKEP